MTKRNKHPQDGNPGMDGEFDPASASPESEHGGDVEALRAQLQGARVETIEPSLEDVFVTLTYQIMEAAR